MRTLLVEIQCQDFSVVSCSSKSTNINSTLLKCIGYNNLPILFACSPHWYLLFVCSLTWPLMVWIAYDRIAYAWLSNRLQLHLQVSPNRLQLTRLRSNRHRRNALLFVPCYTFILEPWRYTCLYVYLVNIKINFHTLCNMPDIKVMLNLWMCFSYPFGNLFVPTQVV